MFILKLLTPHWLSLGLCSCETPADSPSVFSLPFSLLTFFTAFSFCHSSLFPFLALSLIIVDYACLNSIFSPKNKFFFKKWGMTKSGCVHFCKNKKKTASFVQWRKWDLFNFLYWWGRSWAGYQFQGVQLVWKSHGFVKFSFIAFLQCELPPRKCRNPSRHVQHKVLLKVTLKISSKITNFRAVVILPLPWNRDICASGYHTVRISCRSLPDWKYTLHLNLIVIWQL